MSIDNKKSDTKKTLSLSSKGTLGLKNLAPKAGTAGSSSGKSSVTVEVKRKQAPGAAFSNRLGGQNKQQDADSSFSNLSPQEREARQKAIEAAQKRKEEGIESKLPPPVKHQPVKTLKEEKAQTEESSADKKQSARSKELEELRKIEENEQAAKAGKTKKFAEPAKKKFSKTEEVEDEKDTEKKKPRLASKEDDDEWGGGKLTVNQALNYEYEIEQRQRSLAAQRRARQKEKRKMAQENDPVANVKQVRKVIVPETITVGELAKRMTEKTTDIIKFLMKMDMMATQNQYIDADTAELVIEEFGHSIQRVTEADVEIGIEDINDIEKNMVQRAPVVTIMGHVDHGKTSILDALRATDVVSGEAGGITQHIGAYQVTLSDDRKITFIDTPGHAAFSEMRARGANATDIVVLVVAANDSIMPQTIEAISHAKAAEVPIIVAINKCDLPEANPKKVKEDLLQHEVIVEDFSGDIQAIEVSAKTRVGLDKLEEAILLQSEILELKANPNREGRGVVIEAKLDKGRGSVATILVQKGTLKVGDIFICGKEFGRIRVLNDARGRQLNEAGPSVPVEVIGLNGTPMAGDDFVVVNNETKAKEIAEYRQRLSKDKAALATMSSVEQLFAQAKEGEKKTLSIILKADVHGSVEAIQGALKKLSDENDEVDVKVIHSGVGEITEADITLANASNGAVIGFNVRANAQARDKAKRDNREIRYYSIIYNVIDDMKALVSGLLSPIIKETFIGYAEIRQVFNVSKVGKVAGCMITEGFVKRGAKVRLLRDNVVIHEGMLKTLRRFKEEVKEAREGMECGMALENYDDIKENDMIECFEVTEEAQTLD